MYTKGIVVSYIFAVGLLLFSVGCQTTIPLDDFRKKKDVSTEQNLTLDQAIALLKLERADNLYLDFRESHPESPATASLMLRLSKAHMELKEYLLAKYYAESYASDFPDGKRIEEAWYLQLRSLFLRFKDTKESSEDLFRRFTAAAEVYVSEAHARRYRDKVKEMIRESQVLQKQRNDAIAMYYEKHGKHKAAEYYRNLRTDSSKAVKDTTSPLDTPQ